VSFNVLISSTGHCVADNPMKDFIPPHERGWTTVRVRRAGSLHEDLDSGPDVQWELPSLDGPPHELIEILP
jgi:hypothetical protein